MCVSVRGHLIKHNLILFNNIMIIHTKAGECTSNICVNILHIIYNMIVTSVQLWAFKLKTNKTQLVLIQYTKP